MGSDALLTQKSLSKAGLGQDGLFFVPDTNLQIASPTYLKSYYIALRLQSMYATSTRHGVYNLLWSSQSYSWTIEGVMTFNRRQADILRTC